MLMTQYMTLLMENAPYNLIFFMVVPMVIAETIAITEIVNLYKVKRSSLSENLNLAASIIGGLVMMILGVFFIKEVIIPVTQNHQWKGWIDIAASYCFLASVIPLALLTLLQCHLIFFTQKDHVKKGIKIGLLTAYLVTSHAAMAFGMLDPAIGMSVKPVFSMPMDHSMMNHGSMNMEHTMMGHSNHMQHYHHH